MRRCRERTLLRAGVFRCYAIAMGRGVGWVMSVAWLAGCASSGQPAPTAPTVGHVADGAEESPAPAPEPGAKDTETGSQQAASAGGSPAGTSPAEPPSAPCRGQMTDALLRALTARAAQSRTCYEQLLRTSPKAEGRLLVELSISEGGKIVASSVVEDDLGEAELSACAVAYLTAGEVPAPVDGCATVRVPLRFMPKKADPPSGEAP